MYLVLSRYLLLVIRNGNITVVASTYSFELSHGTYTFELTHGTYTFELYHGTNMYF